MYDEIVILEGSMYRLTGSSVTTVQTSGGAIYEAGVRSVGNTFGLTSIASIAWELTTLSWVADYFLNLGGILYYLNPSSGFKQRISWITTTSSVKTDVVLTLLDSDGKSTPYSWHFADEKRKKDRLTDIGTPELISFENNLDLPKIFDITGVIYGLLKSHKLKAHVK